MRSYHRPPILELSCDREYTRENSLVNMVPRVINIKTLSFMGTPWYTSTLKLICSRKTKDPIIEVPQQVSFA